jgi:radical SAM protein with 4Fe4S-binding SPASM domain
MDLETFKEIVNQMAGFMQTVGLRFVRHGEPTLHKKLSEMISYAHCKGILTFLSTNGLLLTKELVRAYIERGLDEVRFSMQGTNRMEYSKLRNIDAYPVFQEKVALFRRIRDEMGSRTFISLSTSVTDETQDQIQKFKDFWSSIVDRVIVDKTIFTRFEHIERVQEYINRQTFDKKYKPCTEVMTKLSINYNGDITPCCKDFNGELVVGNIKDISLHEAWRSPKLSKLREILGEAREHFQINLCKNCYPVSNKFDQLKERVKDK